MLLTVLKQTHEIPAVCMEFDCDKTGGRYQVTLAYDPLRDIYIISSPNYFVSVETSNPNGCADKIMEHDVSRPDANAIGEAVKQFLLPALKEKIGV